MAGDQHERLRAVGCDERGVDCYSICGVRHLAGSMVAAPVILHSNPAFAVQVPPLGEVLRLEMGLERRTGY